MFKPSYPVMSITDMSQGSLGEMAMSFVIAAPELVSAAAEDLAGIRSALGEAAAAAATPTTGVAAAAGDEVSAVSSSQRRSGSLS